MDKRNEEENLYLKSQKFFIFSLLIFLTGICFLIASWGVRQKMIELDNWKATYESGYCPTCGAKMESEADNGNVD